MLGFVVLRGREGMEEGRGLSQTDGGGALCRERRVSAGLGREVAGPGQGQQEAGMAGIVETRGDGDRKLCGPWISVRILAFLRILIEL